MFYWKPGSLFELKNGTKYVLLKKYVENDGCETIYVAING